MKRLISIHETCQILGLGRTKVYDLIKIQKLDTCHIGRRHLVKAESIERLMQGGD
jgi:excisionase family DNA binding protein